MKITLAQALKEKNRLAGELNECAPAKKLSALSELPELTPVVIDDEPNRKDNI